MTQEPAELDVSAPARSPWRNLSVIWLVPLAALVISLAVAWRSYADRGVLIEIRFLNAAGVTAGETTVRYRDVIIGLVEDVAFTDDLGQVRVSARVEKNIAPFLDDSARFWVVRPEVTAQGISGLSTVLSGVYIEGNWDNQGGSPIREFQGLEKAPLIRLNEEGTRVTLRSSDGTIMSAGAPVFYRGIRVGRTETPRLDETASVVLVEAFIEAPHDQLLTTATRFWDTSGFSVSFGAGGLELNVESLAALVSGGVAFNTFFEGGEPVEAGQIYDLHGNEAEARENVFTRMSANTVMLATIFDGGVSGLSTGAALEYEGLPIGQVESISAYIAEEEDAGPEVKQQVVLSVDPERLGLPRGAGLAELLDFLDSAVATGVRARLTTANLLSSALIVELVRVEEAAPARLNRDAEPYPVIPSAASDLPDVNATLEGVMSRVNALKIEELIDQAISTMASIEAIAANKDTRAAPEALVALLTDARKLIGSEETRALPGELRAATEELRGTIARINEAQAIERLASALASADAAAANIALASEQFPGLTEELRAAAVKANSLQTEELVDAATQFLDSAEAVVGTDAARALPNSLSAALDEIRVLVSELRDGGVVENTNSAIASARAATESLEAATADLPALSKRLDRLVARSEELVAAYGNRSDFNDETLAMLREVRAAARAVSALTRALERNPNSILFGK